MTNTMVANWVNSTDLYNEMFNKNSQNHYLVADLVAFWFNKVMGGNPPWVQIDQQHYYSVEQFNRGKKYASKPRGYDKLYQSVNMNPAWLKAAQSKLNDPQVVQYKYEVGMAVSSAQKNLIEKAAKQYMFQPMTLNAFYNKVLMVAYTQLTPVMKPYGDIAYMFEMDLFKATMPGAPKQVKYPRIPSVAMKR